MRRFCCVFLLVGFTISGWKISAAEKSDLSKSPLIQRLNERYDDFFKHQREQEEWDQRRDVGREKIKEVREAHKEQLERAREEYVQSRRAKPDDKAAYQKWLANEAAWKEKLDVARRKLVEKRNTVEDLRRRGRSIPPLKEYDLEDY